MTHGILNRRTLRFAFGALLFAALLTPLAAAVNDEEALRVEGWVLTADGQRPVAGAEIALRRFPPSFQRGLVDLGSGAAPAVDSARSDKSGRFVVRAPTEGAWRVTVMVSGAMVMEYRLVPLLADKRLPPLRIQPAEKLEVRVVDDEGRGVGGARVLVGPVARDPVWEKAWSDGWRPRSRWARTDAGGRARLLRAPGEALWGQAWSAGFLESEVARLAGGSSAAGALTLTLPAGASTAIEVIDPQRQPVVGMLVRVGDRGWPRGLTDEQGRIELTVPPAAPLSVTLESADGFLQRLVVSADGRPDPVRLDPVRRLNGRITRSESEQPLVGALVWVRGAPSTLTRAAADGTFELPIAGQGMMRLRAAAAGHLPRTVEVETAAATSFPVIAMERAAFHDGEVKDSDGLPIERARLELVITDPPQGVGPPARALTFSGADGRFELTGVAATEAFELLVSREGFVRARLEVPAGGDGEHEIVLRPGGAGFGRILDLAEAPVVGAEVRLVPRNGAGEARAVLSGTDGQFELTGLEPGRYDLEARAEGFAPAVAPGVEVRGESAVTDLGTLLLAAHVLLEGRVEDIDGQLIEGARVELTPTSGAPVPDVVTGADGMFTFRGLSPGERVDLRAAAPGHAAAVLSGVEVPAADAVRLVLEWAVPVVGRVVDEEGAGLADVRVELRPEAGGYLDAATDEAGAFRVDGAPPGTATLMASAAGYLSARHTDLILETGVADGLEVVLRRGCVVEGRVLAPDGGPVPGARVRPLPIGAADLSAASAVAEVRSDAEGRYRLDAVAPGPRLLEARHEDYPPVVRQMQVRDGVTRSDINSVDIVFEAGAEVAGRIIDAEGAPLAEARVTLRGSGAEQRQAVSSSGGGFRFTSVPDGSYRLHGEKHGWASAVSPRTVEVAGQHVEGLELSLEPGGLVIGRLLGLELTELTDVEVSASDAVERIETGETDYDGRFRVGPLGPGEWWVVAALADGRQERARVELAPGQAEASVDLDFGDGLEVAGRVLVDGAPGRNLTVTLAPLDGLALPPVSTDEGGRFRLSGLESGRHQLHVEDLRRGLSHREEVALAAGEELLVVIESTQVAGRVLSSEDRRSLADASVSLLPAEDASASVSASVSASASASSTAPSTATGDEGNFRFDGVTEGHWRLVARARGHAAAERPLVVRAGERLTGVEVVLDPVEGLTLEVRLASGRPPGRVHAVLEDAAAQPVAAGTYAVDAAGEVHLTEAPPGRWRLLLAAPGTGTVELAVDVPGRPSPVILPAAGSLEVRVVELADSDRAARLTLRSDAGHPLRLVAPGGRVETMRPLYFGHTVLDGVPAGIWSLRVEEPDGRTWVATLPVEPGQRVAVEPSPE